MKIRRTHSKQMAPFVSLRRKQQTMFFLKHELYHVVKNMGVQGVAYPPLGVMKTKEFQFNLKY